MKIRKKDLKEQKEAIERDIEKLNEMKQGSYLGKQIIKRNKRKKIKSFKKIFRGSQAGPLQDEVKKLIDVFENLEKTRRDKKEKE